MTHMIESQTITKCGCHNVKEFDLSREFSWLVFLFVRSCATNLAHDEKHRTPEMGIEQRFSRDEKTSWLIRQEGSSVFFSFMSSLSLLTGVV